MNTINIFEEIDKEHKDIAHILTILQRVICGVIEAFCKKYGLDYDEEYETVWN